MSHLSRSIIALLVTLLMVTPLVAGCQPMPAPAPAPVATTAAPTATAVPPTATPAGPAVGGTLVDYLPAEPNTLDPITAIWVNTLGYLGSSLVAMDPDGTYVGYLAESWEVKEGARSMNSSSSKASSFTMGIRATPMTMPGR